MLLFRDQSESYVSLGVVPPPLLQIPRTRGRLGPPSTSWLSDHSQVEASTPSLSLPIRGSIGQGQLYSYMSLWRSIPSLSYCILAKTSVRPLTPLPYNYSVSQIPSFGQYTITRHALAPWKGPSACPIDPRPGAAQ